MKFIRFGDLKAFEQKRYKRCPDVDEFKHCPPRRRGFFAFPYGFLDQSYLVHHPASEPHSPMVYLRGKDGKKITKADFREEWVLDGYYDDRIDDLVDVIHLDDRVVLKKLGLPKLPVFWEPRDSWVCIMKNSSSFPRWDDDTKRLYAEFDYLTDETGERVPAGKFFYRRWGLGDFEYENYFPVCRPCDISDGAWDVLGLECKDIYVNHPEKGVRSVLEYLGRRGIHYRRLFAWPVYQTGEEAWLTTFKKPHMFDYDGCLWHHLRAHVPPRAVLSSYGTIWVYTTVRDFGLALKKASPFAYNRHLKVRNATSASLFGGPHWFNGEYSIDWMCEVFFDEEDIKKIS